MVTAQNLHLASGMMEISNETMEQRV